MTRNLKKIIFLTISILLVLVVFADPTNPIPSFDYQLRNSAIFQEVNSGPSNPAPPNEKRDMNVSNDGSAGHGKGHVVEAVVIYIYRLDGGKTHGPFFVAPGETVTIPIDGHKWGVYAQSHTKTLISVWTNKDH